MRRGFGEEPARAATARLWDGQSSRVMAREFGFFWTVMAWDLSSVPRLTTSRAPCTAGKCFMGGWMEC